MEEQIKILDLSSRLRDFIYNSSFRPPMECNLLEIIDPDESSVIGETKISRMILSLFKYKNEFGDYTILTDFIKHFLCPVGFNVSLVSQPVIEREKFNIDIIIHEENKYAIIIENKIKDAVFQSNQLARYIETVKSWGFKDPQIFVVVLPKQRIDINYINEEVWTGPTTQINYKKEYAGRTIFPQSKFSEWLENEEQEIPLRETNIRSALLQLADYLNGLYRNKANKRFVMEKTEFIRKELNINLDLTGRKKLNEVLSNLEETKKTIEYLQIRISHELIDQWYNSLKTDWPMMEYDPHISFGLRLKDNLLVGCRFNKDSDGDEGGDNLPYWGFRFITKQDKIDDKQEHIILNILKSSGLDSFKLNFDDNMTLLWQKTDEGDKVCRQLFSSAKKMGYIKEENG